MQIMTESTLSQETNETTIVNNVLRLIGQSTYQISIQL
jgi:hypothetical protein